MSLQRQPRQDLPGRPMRRPRMSRIGFNPRVRAVLAPPEQQLARDGAAAPSNTTQQQQQASSLWSALSNAGQLIGQLNIFTNAAGGAEDVREVQEVR